MGDSSENSCRAADYGDEVLLRFPLTRLVRQLTDNPPSPRSRGARAVLYYMSSPPPGRRLNALHSATKEDRMRGALNIFIILVDGRAVMSGSSFSD
jgi:hypothetical protein